MKPNYTLSATSLRDLVENEKTLCAPADTAMTAIVRRRVPGLNVLELDGGFPALVHRLLEDADSDLDDALRCDAVLVPEVKANYFAQQRHVAHGGKRVDTKCRLRRVANLDVGPRFFALGLPRLLAGAGEALSVSIARLREGGALRQLEDKWFGAGAGACAAYEEDFEATEIGVAHVLPLALILIFSGLGLGWREVTPEMLANVRAKALAGGADRDGDGVVSNAELAAYAKKEMVKAAKKGWHVNTSPTNASALCCAASPQVHGGGQVCLGGFLGVAPKMLTWRRHSVYFFSSGAG